MQSIKLQQTKYIAFFITCAKFLNKKKKKKWKAEKLRKDNFQNLPKHI